MLCKAKTGFIKSFSEGVTGCKANIGNVCKSGLELGERERERERI
jgi:hypothetical protein